MEKKANLPQASGSMGSGSSPKNKNPCSPCRTLSGIHLATGSQVPATKRESGSFGPGLLRSSLSAKIHPPQIKTHIIPRVSNLSLLRHAVHSPGASYVENMHLVLASRSISGNLGPPTSSTNEQYDTSMKLPPQNHGSF